MRIIWVLLVCAWPGVALAQAPAASEPAIPQVTTSGQGIVRRAPDRAWVTIAAESRARTPEEAQRANAAAMSAVNDKVKASGVPSDAIQTIGFDLQPEFDYVSGRQVLRDYVARNRILVKVDAIAKLGSVIAAAVGTGATNIGGVRFDLQDRDAVERDALRRAVADARARAEAAASGAGMRLDHVIRIEEHRDFEAPPPRPMAMVAARADAPAPVPIESGEMEIRVLVTLTAAIK